MSRPRKIYDADFKAGGALKESIAQDSIQIWPYIGIDS